MISVACQNCRRRKAKVSWQTFPYTVSEIRVDAYRGSAMALDQPVNAATVEASRALMSLKGVRH